MKCKKKEIKAEDIDIYITILTKKCVSSSYRVVVNICLQFSCRLQHLS